MSYEMLTGRLPFGAGSFVDVAVRQESETRRRGGVLQKVSEVLRRALSMPARAEAPLTLARASRSLGE